MRDSIPDRLKAALEAIEYMPNAVAAWEDAHGGRRALARKNAEKVREAERLLAEVLASLPAAVEYVVYGLTRTPMRFGNREDLVWALKEEGIRFTGDEERSNLKPELIGQPRFDKLVGPMYDGPGVVRYETAEVNDVLSR